MVLHMSVILFTVGGVWLSAYWNTHPPPGKETPLARQIPLARRQGDPPGKVDPPRKADLPPRCSACWEIRRTSRWYASYWNANLVLRFFFKVAALLYEFNIEHHLLSTCLLVRWKKFDFLQNNCIIHEILALHELLKMIYIGGLNISYCSFI